MKREEILRKLREVKPFLQSRYKVRSLGLFGSWARDEAHPGSDIDVLVEFTTEADLLDWIGLMLYLQDLLERPVDLIPKNALRTELQDEVLQEVIVV